MRKKLLFLMAVLMASLSTLAETPKEAYAKHSDAPVVLFFKTPKFNGSLENFDIERIAFYTSPTPRVAIKIVGRDKDIVKEVDGSMDSDMYSIGVMFKDGSALAVDTDMTYMMYMSTKKQTASFLIDEYRQKLYTKLTDPDFE